MKNLYTRGLMLSPVLVILFMTDIHAQSFVYTDNNVFGPNSVTAFSIAGNGALTNIGTFATGGTGANGGFFASNRARTCTVGNRLYVANDGSNSVTGFDINPITGSLSLVPGSPFVTGGVAGLGISLDCVPNGQFLIAANAGSNNITVFSIAGNGALTPVVGSPFAAGGIGADGIKVAPNGQFLSVALFSNDAIGMFSIAPNGALTPVPGSPFASPADGNVAGVDINCTSTFLYGAQAAFVDTNVDVFSIGPNGALTLVQTSNNPGVGENSNVAVLSPNDQFLFASNQFSNSVTAFNVAANGTLSLVAGSPFLGTGGEPSGVATNAAGTFVFTANYDNSTVTSFSIAGNGVLTLVGSFVTGQPNFSGLESLTVFPGKSCSTSDCTIQCPPTQTVTTGPGATQCCAVVNYPAPTTTGNCGTVNCSPASGTCFPVGTTTVTCTTTAGPSCSFLVVVVDNTPPGITCPQDIIAVGNPGDFCVPVNFTVSATDNCAGVIVQCVNNANPGQMIMSGFCFPTVPHCTTVKCTATDASANTAVCTFNVCVFDVCMEDDANPCKVLLFDSFTGDYIFCCCTFSLSGTGTVKKKGGTWSLTHTPPDRRVQVTLDIFQHRGSANLQFPVGTPVCSIQDRDTRNNSCQCGGGRGGGGQK